MTLHARAICVREIYLPICASFLLRALVCFGVWVQVRRWQSRATSGDLSIARDQRLMRRMNRWRAPRWFRIWMIAATRMGDGWIWYGLA